MLEICDSTVDEWANDCNIFVTAFVSQTTAMFRTVGIDISFERSVLTEAHAMWVEEKKRWENNLFEEENHNLSEIKVLSILLWALTSKGFILECRDYEPQDGDETYEFESIDGLEAHRNRMRNEARIDFLNAPDIICALDFCISVINAYEQVRLDRQTAFDPFLTREFRHNLIYFLKQGGAEALSTYTILEAHYSRFSKI